MKLNKLSFDILIIRWRWQCYRYLFLLLYLATWCFSGDRPRAAQTRSVLCVTLVFIRQWGTPDGHKKGNPLRKS